MKEMWLGELPEQEVRRVLRRGELAAGKQR
jgi:hypothetical protein